MGLDMYLHRAKLENENIRKLTEKNSELVAYWRKANAIHNWFAHHVADGKLEDCKSYEVTIDQFRQLVKDCRFILANVSLVNGKVWNGETFDQESKTWVPVYVDGKVVDNPAICAEYMPSVGGFFFGSTEYDEYYIEDLQDTIRQLEPIINGDSGEDTYFYHAWW